MDIFSTDFLQKLDRDGYYYQQHFIHRETHLQKHEKKLVKLAKTLGALYLPKDRPVIITKPQPMADQSKPFNRGQSIGWHNDFSTKTIRPRYSLSLIIESDPGGDDFGAWRLASVAKVISLISSRQQGKKLLNQISDYQFPYGYLDSKNINLFPMLKKNIQGDYVSLRFYGRALHEGAQYNKVSLSERIFIDKVIKTIEGVADQVGITRAATTGSLMVVDNHFSLHDRLKQTTKHQRNATLRTAMLCFVK